MVKNESVAKTSLSTHILTFDLKITNLNVQIETFVGIGNSSSKKQHNLRFVCWVVENLQILPQYCGFSWWRILQDPIHKKMPAELRMVFHMCQRYWPHAHTPIIPWNMAITGFSYLKPFEQPSKLTFQCTGWFIGILTTANIVIPMKQGSKIQKTKSCPEDVFCTRFVFWYFLILHLFSVKKKCVFFVVKVHDPIQVLAKLDTVD